MAELARDGVRRLVAAERPGVDRSAGARVRHREVAPIDGRLDARGIGVEKRAHAIEVAERGGHEDVGPAAARDEKARDVLPFANRVLRRRRLVVDVEGVDVGTVIHAGSARLRRSRRRAAASVRRRRACATADGILAHQPLDVVESPELRGAVDRHRDPALEQERDDVRFRPSRAGRSRRPTNAILTSMSAPDASRSRSIISLFCAPTAGTRTVAPKWSPGSASLSAIAQLCVLREQSSRALDVVRVHRRHERFHRIARSIPRALELASSGSRTRARHGSRCCAANHVAESAVGRDGSRCHGRSVAFDGTRAAVQSRRRRLARRRDDPSGDPTHAVSVSVRQCPCRPW